MESAKGVALICNAEGEILEKFYDAWSRFDKGKRIADVVDEFDRPKMARMLATAASERHVLGWEMHVGGQLTTFAALAFVVDTIVVIGTQEPQIMARLHHDLMGMNNELTNALRETEKERTLSRRALEPSLDDFVRLNNEMASLHRETTKRARELENLNRELEKRKREMDELDARRERFIQHLVHDLRTPLTSVRGAISMALGGVFGPLDETAAEALTLAQDGCTKLMDMVTSLLDLAKAESGQLDTNLEPISVDETIEKVVRELQNRAKESDVTLKAATGERLFFKADRGFIGRILANFIINAIKFSPAGKPVTIESRREGTFVRVAIKDEGPGIPPDQASRLFTRFGQIERRGMSTGLGLAFCKELTEAMGGKVGYDSIQGRGATFFFELPAADP